MKKILNKNSTVIIAAVTLISLVVASVDAFLKPDYWTKVPLKSGLFLVLPLLYFFIAKEGKSLKELFRFRFKTLLWALGFGLAIYGVIVGGYFATRSVIDFASITGTLTEDNGISAENFLWVSLYISFMNSFLEEFFFRGFAFLALEKHTGHKFANFFSAALFAAYHTGMLVLMFEWWVLPLLFLGLFAGGLIFNFLNRKGGSLYTSWFCHMFANFGINTVAFILFGLI